MKLFNNRGCNGLINKQFLAIVIKGKVNLSLCLFLTEHQDVKAYWESLGIPPRIFDVIIRWR